MFSQGGTGKTVISKAGILKDFCFADDNLFYAWVSATQKLAIGNMDYIKYHLEYNEKILYYFGNLRGNKWTNEEIETSNDCKLISKSNVSGIRGGSKLHKRYDLICHKIGTKIFTNNRWMNVEDHKTARYKIDNGYRVEMDGIPNHEVVTGDHKYWCSYYKKQYCPGVKNNILKWYYEGWMTADEIGKVDKNDKVYIGLPINKKRSRLRNIKNYNRGYIGHAFKRNIFKDKEWWWLIGLWWGDGHLAGKHQVGITVADSEPHIMNRIKDLLNRSEIKHTVVDCGDRKCSQLIFSFSALNNFLRKWKRGNAMKFPPQWVEEMDIALQKELVCGYLDADGYVDTKNNQVRLTSVFLDGLHSVRRILARIGVPSTIRNGTKIRFETFPNGHSSFSRKKYELRFRDNASLLGYEIKKQDRYRLKNVIIDDDYLWTSVRRVKSEPQSIFVPVTTTDNEYLTVLGKSHNCLDDFEHEANTLTPMARDKNANLVTAVVEPALEPHTGRLRINGTPVHYDSFINNILINHKQAKDKGIKFEWDLITYKAILPDGTALWPSFFPLELLEQKKRFARDSGNPAKFYQEYMMEVQSEEDSLFNRHQIQYHEGIYLHEDGINYLVIGGDKIPVLTFIGCDPATDINTKDSDYSVVMVIAIDNRNNLYVLDYAREKAIPTIGMKDGDKTVGKLGVVDHIFRLYDKYHCKLGTVEDVAMNRSVFQSLDSERIRMNRFDVAIKPAKPGGRDKRNRIYSILNSRFALKTVYLRPTQYELIDEIITFGPRMGKDDSVDALAYATMNAYPPNYSYNEDNKSYSQHKPKAKSWKLA